MNRLSKWFLTGSIVLTAVGVLVSFKPVPLSAVWTISLPYGAILFGLFLISFVFQKEFADSRQGEQSDMHSSQQRKDPPSGKDLLAEAGITPHRAAYG